MAAKVFQFPLPLSPAVNYIDKLHNAASGRKPSPKTRTPLRLDSFVHVRRDENFIRECGCVDFRYGVEETINCDRIYREKS